MAQILALKIICFFTYLSIYTEGNLHYIQRPVYLTKVQYFRYKHIWDKNLNIYNYYFYSNLNNLKYYIIKSSKIIMMINTSNINNLVILLLLHTI